MNEPHTRAQWADELNAAEIARDDGRQLIARHAYFGLSVRAIYHELASIKADKNFRPGIRELHKLADDISVTMAEMETLLGVGEDFRTLREKIDGEIAYERAWRFYNLAHERWEANLEAQRAERVRYRDRPAKQRPRRTVLVDGVRTKLETV